MLIIIQYVILLYLIVIKMFNQKYLDEYLFEIISRFVFNFDIKIIPPSGERYKYF